MMRIYYAGVRFDEATNTALRGFRSAHNLQQYPKPAMGFHSTFAYSRRPFELNMTSAIPMIAIGTVGDQLELWKESLVLPYRSQWLTWLHTTALAGGASWDHQGNFIPHITIASEVTYLPSYFHHQIPVKVLEMFYSEWDSDDRK